MRDASTSKRNRGGDSLPHANRLKVYEPIHLYMEMLLYRLSMTAISDYETQKRILSICDELGLHAIIGGVDGRLESVTTVPSPNMHCCPSPSRYRKSCDELTRN